MTATGSGGAAGHVMLPKNLELWDSSNLNLKTPGSPYAIHDNDQTGTLITVHRVQTVHQVTSLQN